MSKNAGETDSSAGEETYAGESLLADPFTEQNITALPRFRFRQALRHKGKSASGVIKTLNRYDSIEELNVSTTRLVSPL